MRRTRRFAAVAALFVAAVGTVCSLAAPPKQELTEPAVPADVRTALQDRRYEEAIRGLDALMEARKEAADYWLYLKGLSQLHAKDYQGAVETLGVLERQHPDSPWVHKARFTAAEAHLANKEYREAEAIYEAEARRLMGEARKDRLADTIIALADKLATPRDETKPDSPKPDYGRARDLYLAALDLEISPALRDDVMFKVAQTMVAAQDWGQAISRLVAYLAEFDPDWDRGPYMAELGPEAARQVRKAQQAGKHVHEARFDLGGAMQKAGRPFDARRVWQDLAKMAAGRIEQLQKAEGAAEELATLQKLRAAAMYQIAGTYPTGEPGQALLAVKALKDFLAQYPAAEQSVQAAFDIAADYAAIGRDEDAAAAYRDFVAGKGFRAETEKAKDLLGGLSMEAQFRLGQICLAQKKYDDAKTVWNSYIANYPSGPRWNDCQQGIVEAEYRVGADLSAQKQYEAAREAWQAFLTKYPLDRRAGEIMFQFGQMAWLGAEELNKQKPEDQAGRDALYTQAIASWQKLVSKYPGTEESSHGQFTIGQVYEMNLRQLEKAVEEYRKCTWGSFAPQAAQRIRQMTERQLVLLTERVWRTNEPARVKVQMRNVEKLTVNLYRLDLEDYFRKMQRITGVEELDTLLIDADKTLEVDARDYARYKPIEQEIEVPLEEGRPGVFAVRVTGAGLQATTLVIRSNMDIAVKSSRKALLVFAEDMVEQKPWPAAKVVVSDGNKVFFEGQTGADGVLYKTFQELKSAEQVSVLAVADGHVASNALSVAQLQASQGLQPQGFIYTDRPAYRPGQTVRIRAILREVTQGTYSFEAGKEHVLEVVDSQGRVLATQRLPLSEFGTAHYEFSLDDFAPTGAYTVRCHRPNGPTFSGTFDVQLYKLEKMELSFELAKRVVFRGEPLEGKLTARYYYGEPVAGREVEYFLPDGRRQTATTDAKGQVAFSFDTTPMQDEQPLLLRASIPGENVAAQATAFLAIRAYSASVSLLRPVYLAGEPFDVTVRTVDVEAKPVSQSMTLKVLKRESAPDGTWAETLVLEKPVTTDAKSGRGAVSVTLDKGGEYILRAEGTDRFGNPVSAEAMAFISDAEDATRLRILADRQHYKVGETAAVTLHSRLAPTLALLTFEGEEIISYRVARLAEGKNPIEIPIGNEHFPNFALGACVMAGNKFHAATQEFTVERELTVALKPDKETYLPGEKASVQVLATDQNGNPVAAELSLAMVDESLFGVFPDKLPAIRDVFEEGARRVAALAVTTSCTFSYHPRTTPVPEALISEKERLERAKLEEDRRGLITEKAQELGQRAEAVSAPAPMALADRDRAAQMVSLEIRKAVVPPRAGGMGQKELLSAGLIDISGRAARGGAGAALPPEFATFVGMPGAPGAAPPAPPREAFPETAYWNPAVVTDKDGKAAVTIEMPASMTKWRLTARGTTAETLVGQQTASVVTKKDFFVELKLPAILTEGDSVRFVCRVHNLTDYVGPAELRLKIAADEAQETLPAKLDLAGRGIVERVFEAWKVPDAEKVSLTLEAKAGAQADALAQRVPVRPWGIQFADSHSGLVEDQATFELALPSDRSYKRQALMIQIDPGLQQRLMDLALWRGPIIIPLEASCPLPTHADAASELLAVASVMDYVQALALQQSPAWKLLADRAQSHIATLLVTQREDGGWAWAGDKQKLPDPYSSSRAVWALGEAKRIGLSVPEDALAKGVGYLKQAYSEAPQEANELKAVILHALAVVHEADFGFVNRLYRLRESLSPSALAHTAICLALLDRGPMAADVLDVLESKRQPLEGSLAGQTKWPAAGNESWLRSDDEMTAMALLAYLYVRPEAPSAKQAVDYLMAHQPWQPARARGPALAALSRWFRKDKPMQDDYRLTLRVGGQQVKTLEVRGPAASQTVQVPSALIKPNKTRVDLVLEGRGRPHYVAVLTGFSEDLSPVSLPAGRFRVDARKYLAAAPEYKGKPAPVGFSIVHDVSKIWQNRVAHVPVGTVANVRLYVEQAVPSVRGGPEARTPAARMPLQAEYLTVREPLPAGTSVLEGSIQGNFDYYRLGDGEITFFSGNRTWSMNINYSLVAYAPGDFRVLPTVVQSVYSPGTMAIGPADAFEVLDRSERSKDPYEPTPDELYYLGKACFDDNLYAEAQPRLERLFEQWQQNLHDEPYRETAKMLLFISIESGDARKIVRYFEVIKEKYPALVIPFDKVLAVGKAYKDMEEFERAMLVFKATIAASFVKDAHVAGVLEQQGQPLGSVDYMKDLWLYYPDIPAVTDAYLALSDTLYNLAPKAGEVAELKEKKLTHDDLMLEAIKVLVQYLTLYPENPTADDAALNLVNAYLKLGDFKSTIQLCRALRERFPESRFLDSFEYVEALALWNLSQYDEATGVAAKVAETIYKLPDGTEKPSDNKDLALYIIGQIWHARGVPAKAIEYYEKVKGMFADAAEAIAYFEQKGLALEEVSTFEPGQQVEVTLKYRNIPEAHVLVYRVDLMTLYLTEKNLSRIARVKLAGIHPAMEPLRVELGEGKDYAEKQKVLPLPLKDSGAYLVICRGGDLYASGMVLVTPLKLEVQEDKVSGRVRVNVMDEKTGAYQKNVHVKVIGSANPDFMSGQTDLRGVFIADGVRGTATVIARGEDGQFAFYRGKEALGKPPERAGGQPAVPGVTKGVSYLSNVDEANRKLQQGRLSGQQGLFQQKQAGVQVEQMMQQ